MKGVCIDTGNATTLEKGKQYYLFEHGPNNYYVSQFNNIKSHFGSYQKRLFKEIEVRPHDLEGKYYARLKRPQRSFKMDKIYIVGPAEKHKEYFNVYSVEVPHRPFGSYLNNFFEILEPYEEPEKPDAVKTQNKAITEVLDEKGINAKEQPETNEVKAESKPKVRITGIWMKKHKSKQEKKKKPTPAEKLEDAGQLNIFDFLEG